MILTPLVMRKQSTALIESTSGEKNSNSSPSLAKTNQLLDVPRLNLSKEVNSIPKKEKIFRMSDVLDTEDKKDKMSQREKRESVVQIRSDKRDSGSDDSKAPASGDALLDRESEDKETKEEEEKENEESATSWLQRIRVLLPHVILATVVVCYTMIGGMIFYSLERDNEKEHKTEIADKIRNMRDEYLDRMWNLTQDPNVASDQFYEQSMQELDVVLRETFKAFEEGVTDAMIDDKEATDLSWTYSGAMLFSATIITTIGYGNLVPKTFWGRVFCIIYALLGIPLTLITIADIGKFVGTGITWAYDQFARILEKIGVAFQWLIHKLRSTNFQARKQSRSLSRTSSRVSRRKSSAPSGGKDSRRRRSSVLSVTSASSQKRRRSEQKQNHTFPNKLVDEVLVEEIEENELGITKSEDEKKQCDSEGVEEIEEDEDDELVDDIPVPPSFILMVVVGYTAFTALLFSDWEDWTYLDSFYYCLITITTIGFGDLVPSDESPSIFVLSFIFFGLILATMCIDMVGTHYISRIHYMGRKLQDAKAALAIIGGKAVNMKMWTLQLKKMQKEYGMTDAQLLRLMQNPDEYAHLMEAARLHMMQNQLRAFEPKEAARFRFIDQNGAGGSIGYSPSTPSQVAELLALSLSTGTTPRTMLTT